MCWYCQDKVCIKKNKKQLEVYFFSSKIVLPVASRGGKKTKYKLFENL